MFLGLVTRARRGDRVKEGQRWGWRSCACADCIAASREEGEGGRKCGGETGGERGMGGASGGLGNVGGRGRLQPAGRVGGIPSRCRGMGLP
jgi:hypothetical protein